MRVALFVSRNKDNKYLNNFKERKFAYLYDDESKDSLNKVMSKFDTFTNEGVFGETSRLYLSVNRRSVEKTNKAVVKFLVDEPMFDTVKLKSKTVSLASTKECKETSYWLLDLDFEDGIWDFCQTVDELGEFERVSKLSDIKKGKALLVKTVNGYAYVVGNGFDVRALREKYPNKDFELKKDDMLLYSWAKKEWSK